MPVKTKTKKQFNNVNELIKLAKRTISSKLSKKEKIKSLDALIKQVRKYINSIKKKPVKAIKDNVLKAMESALTKGEVFDINPKPPALGNPQNLLNTKKEEQKEDEKKSKILLQTRDITPITVPKEDGKIDKLIDTQKTELNKLTQNIAQQQKLIEDKMTDQAEQISESNEIIINQLQKDLDDLKYGFEEKYEQFTLDARNAYFLIADQLTKQQEALNKFTIAKIKENAESEKVKLLEQKQEQAPEEPSILPILAEQKEKEQHAKEELEQAEQLLQEVNEETKIVVEEQKKKLNAIESANLARGTKRKERYENVVKRANELKDGGILSNEEAKEFIYLASEEPEQKISPQTVLDFMEVFGKLKESRDKLTLSVIKKQFPRATSIDTIFTSIPKTSSKLNEKITKFKYIIESLNSSKMKGKGLIKKNISDNNIMKPSNSVYELTNGRYGSQYNQVMQNLNMQDREEYVDGSLNNPELQIKSRYNKVVGSGYNKQVEVPAPDQALSRFMSLFYTVGIDGIGRLLDGVPQHDDYIVGLEVYPLPNKKMFNKNNMSNYVGGKLFKDTRKSFNILSKQHKMNKNNKLKELERVLISLSKKYNGGSVEPPLNNSTDVENIEEYELKQPKEEDTQKYKISAFTEDLPEHAPPEIRQLIKDWGNAKIIKSRICRIPLNPIIKKLGNIITKGKLEENKIKLGYNDLFHLYVEVALQKPDGKIGVFAIEKNQKAGYKIINGGLRAGSECINQPPTKNITLSEMFKRAEKTVGANKLWVYNLESANCQDFAVAILGSGNGMLTPEGKKFALQSPSQLLPKYLLNVVKHTTDLANRLKSFMFGKGKKNISGGAYQRMNVMRRRQLNGALSVLDEPRLTTNQINELIYYLVPSSDEIQEEIRYFTREDLPIVEFVIRYLRKLPDNLFNNENQNIIFNDRKTQLIDILENKRQLIRNIERF